MKVPPLFKREISSHKNADLPLFKRKPLIGKPLIFGCKDRHYTQTNIYENGSKIHKNSSR